MTKNPESTKKAEISKEKAMEFCMLPQVEERLLAAGMHPNRARLIRVNEKKWVNGTVLHYFFFKGESEGNNPNWTGSNNDMNAVKSAFKHWKDLGLGLEFKEVADREEAEVRIGFDHTPGLNDSGSWSYIGTDVLKYGEDPNERTMNFGWGLTDDYGKDTALHEIGHTLGYPHEHQNPNSGIEWDEDAVYTYYGGSWDQERIFWNILRKLSPGAVYGSDWDFNSIMHYWFPAGMILKPPGFEDGLVPEKGLSQKDIDWAKNFYPALEPQFPEFNVFEAHRLDIEPGGQVNFLIQPKATRTYTIQTFGESDTVMVLFENQDGEPRFLAGDDDTGEDRNARLRLRLTVGREYILRIRLYYAQRSGETAVFMY